MKLNISIEGHREEDLIDALRETLRLVEGRNRAGAHMVETHKLAFDVEGVPVEKYVLRESGKHEFTVPHEQQYPFLADAVAAKAKGQVVVGLDDGGNFVLIA